MIEIRPIKFNRWGVLTYLLFDETKETLVIDPGNSVKEEDDRLAAFIAKNGLTVKGVVNTHAHLDHVYGNQFLHETYGAPIYQHRDCAADYAFAPRLAQLMNNIEITLPAPTVFVEEGAIIAFGDGNELRVLETPGHAKGSISLYLHEPIENVHLLFCGDVLFDGSIGRTDLPGGDAKTLFESIESKLFTLPKETLVYPGHGPKTTIEKEIKTNPFLQ